MENYSPFLKKVELEEKQREEEFRRLENIADDIRSGKGWYCKINEHGVIDIGLDTGLKIDKQHKGKSVFVIGHPKKKNYYLVYNLKNCLIAEGGGFCTH